MLRKALIANGVLFKNGWRCSEMGRLFAPFHPPRLRLGGNAPKNMAPDSLANAFFKVLAPFLGGHAPKNYWLFGRETGWSCSELSILSKSTDKSLIPRKFLIYILLKHIDS